MSVPNKTRVQVATDSSFSNIIVDEVGDYKTVLALASAELPVGSNLYIRGMHGHPDTGDSPWSTVHQFKVMTPYANELYYTAGDFTFTVPEGVTEICIAATPGVDYSSAGELLKAYTGKTVACVAGNNTVPVGIDSIELSGKGAAGTSSTTLTYTTCTMYIDADTIPKTLSSIPSYIYAMAYHKSGDSTVLTNTRFNLATNNSSTVSYSATVYSVVGGVTTGYIHYNKSVSTTTGASTTAIVNGTTYTFPGGVGGAAAVTTHTVPVNPVVGATISATIASGGTLSYSYSAYAEQAIGSLLGDNFTLSPVAADIGTYSGGIAAWRNAIPVTPGSTIPVRVGSGGAVNIIWGTGRSFPNSEA